MTIATFEDACKLQAELVRTKGLSTEGLAEVQIELAKIGWSTKRLCDEARKRMHARFR